MKRTVLILVLLFITAVATAGNDIWQTLFQEKLREAKQGDSSAQFDVGAMYQNGRGTNPNLEEAVKWYEKAAAQSNTKAVNRLKLLEGNNERFKKVMAQASKGDAKSQYKLGKMYTEGIGTSIDYTKATEAFENSANQGYAKSEYQLGLNYYEGKGVAKSRKTAYKWFKAAADQGHSASQYYLGKMFASGTYVKQSYSTSLKWFSKAVDGGFNQARAEMIDVEERMKMEKAAKSEKKRVAAKAEEAAKAKQIAKAEKASRARETAKAEKASRAKAEKLARAKKAKNLADKKAAARAKIAMQKSAAEKLEKSRKKVAKKKVTPATKTSKAPANKYSGKLAKAATNTTLFKIEDLTSTKWSCDNKPVSFLPSEINTCRREGKSLICYSDSQTKKSGGSKIKFKTKSTLTDFSKDGSFNIAYSNLVIDSKPIGSISRGGDDDEVGSEDTSAGSSYKVKTGWGREHKIECQLEDTSTMSCLKNKTHAFSVVGAQKVAGR